MSSRFQPAKNYLGVGAGERWVRGAKLHLLWNVPSHSRTIYQEFADDTRARAVAPMWKSSGTMHNPITLDHTTTKAIMVTTMKEEEVIDSGYQSPDGQFVCGQNVDTVINDVTVDQWHMLLPAAAQHVDGPWTDTAEDSTNYPALNNNYDNNASSDSVYMADNADTTFRNNAVNFDFAALPAAGLPLMDADKWDALCAAWREQYPASQ